MSLFSQQAIKSLREQYGVIALVDPESPAMQGVRSAVHQMSEPLLNQLVDEEIPWLGTVAATELRMRELLNHRPVTLGDAKD